jgi:Bax protein
VKFFLVFLLILPCYVVAQTDETTKKYIKYLQNLPTDIKKRRFYHLVVPAVEKVDKELKALYKQTQEDIKNKNFTRLNKLIKRYGARNYNDLLVRIKPHPKSITIAQAAIESAWGTSRFFVEANNIFGMWSIKKTDKRVKAAEIRSSGKQIWLRKFDSLHDSVKAYYEMIAKNKAFSQFRKLRFETNNPYILATKLDKYSEKKEKYTIDIIKLIYYNDLTRFDK